MSKYKPVPIPELSITGYEPDWIGSMLAAFKKAHPQHADKIFGLTKRNGMVNIFVVGRTFIDEVGDIRKGRFKVGQYPYEN